MNATQEPTRAPQEPDQAKQTQKPPERGSTYVVQTPQKMRVDLDEGAQEIEVWRDVATVELPLRSHRRSAVMAALTEAEEEGSPGQRFRILDADALAELTLREKPPAPVEERFEVVSAE